MKNLKKFYKEEIKEQSLALKELKKEIKTRQKNGDISASTLQSRLHFDRISMRYLFLAYASVRGKALDTVETNPREAASEAKIKETMLSMEKAFAVKSTAVENV